MDVDQLRWVLGDDAPPALIFLFGTFLLVLFTQSIPSRLFERRTRKVLDQLASEIRNRDTAIASIHTAITALGTLPNPSANAPGWREAREIQSIGNLWSATVDLAPLKALGSATRSLDLVRLAADASPHTPEGQELQRQAATLLAAQGLTDPSQIGKDTTAEKARPFVPPLAWACFAAYRHILLWTYDQLRIAKDGLGAKSRAPTSLIEAAKVALPPHHTALEDHGAFCFPTLYEAFETRILAALGGDASHAPEDPARADSILSLLAAYETERAIEASTRIGMPASMPGDLILAET